MNIIYNLLNFILFWWLMPTHNVGVYIYIYIHTHTRDIGIMVRVFANGQGDLGLIPGWVILKTQKRVLDASLLNTQHYKVRIKGKVGLSWEKSSALPNILV